MSKAIFSILSILVLLLSGINCATGKRSGGVGDASPATPSTPSTPPALSTPSTPPTPDRATDVLETAIDMLRDTGYEIKDRNHDRNHFHVRATNGNANVTLVVTRLSPCLVLWDIRKPTYSSLNTNECDDFRSELERDLRQSLK